MLKNIALSVVTVLAIACGGKSSQPASPANASSAPATETATTEAPAGNGQECNEDGTCGGGGTCLAMCEGANPGDPSCEKKCADECAAACSAKK